MKDDEQLARAVAQRLDDAVDAETAARLSAARRAAVAAAGERRRPGWPAIAVPAGAAAAAAGVALLMLRDATLPALPALDEQELAAASEMQLLDELELLAWWAESGTDEG